MSTEAKKGYFVTFEGIDGCGKSTLLARIESELVEKGYKVKHLSMLPVGSLREIFKAGNFASQAQELLLARALHEEAYRQIRDAIEEGCIVLCDRGPDSYYAYQGAGQEQHDKLVELEKILGSEIIPDLTFYVDISLELSKERISTRGVAKDVFENRDEAYHERVKAHFDEMAEKDRLEVENDVRRWPRVHVLDGQLAPGLVALEAGMKIEELMMRD